MKVKEESDKGWLKIQQSKNEDDGIRPHHFMTTKTVTEFLSWAPKSLQMMTAAMKLKDACSLKEKISST